MSQEWLAPHGGIYVRIAVTRAEQPTMFGQYVEERMVAAKVESLEEVLLALGV